MQILWKLTPLREIVNKIIKFFLPNSNLKIDINAKISLFKNLKFIEVKIENKKVVNINLDLNKATNEQISKLKELYPQIKDNGSIFLQKESYEKYKEYVDESKDIPIMKFFRGKLEEEDFQALRSAIFLDSHFKKGESIQRDTQLQEFYKEFGSRGANIKNLYFEGYFDSFIKPYYLKLKEEGKTEEYFKKKFDEFVKKLPLTYFVSTHKSFDKIKSNLDDKIKISKQYGIKKLNIHGIGSENVKKIQKFLITIKARKDIKIIYKENAKDKI